ncbi:MAG: hypothetical protein A2283_09945 [Lentisphaerae bacterium RIFOXYA12_FULL_48_11]|nr:MAG: hypothetical protein A2283_09945 [Lentisphaerae bacterium RIFOXYA12_FULL_48_11]
MAIKTQRRPYTVHAPYICRDCKTKVQKRDIIAGRAKEIDDTTCICPDCLTKPKKPDPKSQDQIPTVRRPMRQKPQAKLVAENETFIVMVAAAQDDPKMRAQLIGIAQLDNLHREALINSLVSDMLRKGKKMAPIASALELLKDDNVARRTIEVLTKR